MILVTGSAGKTGRAILQALLARRETVRALVHRPEQIAEVKSLGVQEVFAGDMLNLADIQNAFAGVSKVYHICPNVSPDEVLIGRNIIAVAKTVGVERFIFHSVLQPQIQSMPHHWQKLLVEEQLIASGLQFTILQPAVYMQNILSQRESILDQGIYKVPYPTETSLSFVDLQEVAQVAAAVLTESGHENATYPLAGTPGVSQAEIAASLSHIANRVVKVEEVTLADWERQARARGLGDYQVETLVAMFRYYARYGLPGNPQVLRWLLGIPPMNMESFLEGAFLQPVLIDQRNRYNQ
jgi:NAD(P)H dehydrogenase (quinone)